MKQLDNPDILAVAGGAISNNGTIYIPVPPRPIGLPPYVPGPTFPEPKWELL